MKNIKIFNLFIICTLFLINIQTANSRLKSVDQNNQSKSNFSNVSSNGWVIKQISLNTINDIWGISSNEVYTAGINGEIFFWNGQNFNKMEINTDSWFNSIWAASNNYIIVVGNAGAVYKYNGVQWSKLSSTTNENLYEIWADSENNIFICGSNGTLIYYNGTEFIQINTQTNDSLNGIWGLDVNNIYIAGDNGHVYFYNGNSITQIQTDITNKLTAVWASSNNNIYFSGYNGTLLNYNGTSFSKISLTTNDNIYDIWGLDEDNIYIVGAYGQFFKLINGVREQLPVLTDKSLFSIWAVNKDNLFAAGYNGTIVEYKPDLFVIIPDQAIENDSAKQGQIQITSAIESDLEVSLVSSDNTEINIPDTVIIPASFTNVSFDIKYLDDYIFDASKNIRIDASADGFRSGFDEILVHDNESHQLNLQIPSIASESDFVLHAKGNVSTMWRLNEEIRVYLLSNREDKVKVPDFVIIPESVQSVSFDITIVDDTIIDYTQTAAISTNVYNWINSSADIKIIDNEDNKIRLSIPEFVCENDGFIKNAGKVMISGIIDNDIQINLFSGNTSEIILPLTVTISSGTSQESFDITVLNDSIIDGTKLVKIYADCNDWIQGSADIYVLENEAVFEVQQSYTGNNFNTLFSFNDSNIYAAGSNGIIIHYNGVNWEEISSGNSNNINDLWGKDNVLYAVGDKSTLLCYENNSFKSIDEFSTKDINAIWGNSLENIFAVTGNGLVIHYNGESWKLLKITDFSLNDIWGDEQKVFAVGNSGCIYQYNGTKWSIVTSSTQNNLNKISAGSSNNIYAIGDSGTFLNYNGSSWKKIEFINQENLTGIWINSDTNIWLISDSGSLFFYDGIQFQKISKSYNLSLNDILVLSNGTINLAGDNGKILSYKPTIKTIIPKTAYENQGTVDSYCSFYIDYPLTYDLNISLWSSNTSKILQQSNAIIKAGDIWTDFIMYLKDNSYQDGSKIVEIMGVSQNFQSLKSEIMIHDDEKATIILNIDENGIEGNYINANISFQDLVPFHVELNVFLSTDDPGEIQVPEILIIPENQNSFDFELLLIDDDVFDSTQTVKVFAEITGWNIGSDTIYVQDNNKMEFVFTLPDLVNENQGLIENTAMVSLPASFYTDVIISLNSENENQITVTNQVLIPKDSKSAYFDMLLIDNRNIEYLSKVKIFASSPGWITSYSTVTINDDDDESIISIDERNALIDIYYNFNGLYWINKTNWLSELHTECAWFKIGCNNNKTNVEKISLNNNHLSGSISESIKNLNFLSFLNLSNNQIKGNCLKYLVQMNNFIEIILSNNQISGEIPKEIGLLSRLEHFNLSQNQLSGTIPEQLGDIKKLKTLDLSYNNISGEIPLSLSKLVYLENLNLSNNNISGIVPEIFVSLTQLVELEIQNNKLTGNFCQKIQDLNNLDFLNISNNLMTGTIPEAVFNLINIKKINLSNNLFTGSISSSLKKLKNVTWLDLSNNSLSLSIPSELSNCTNLKQIKINGNKLKGSIPELLLNLIFLNDNESDFRYNAIHSDNQQLIEFLNKKQINGNWQSTQTLAPTSINALSVKNQTIYLSWIPDSYTKDEGAYEIHYSPHSEEGPYLCHGTTSDKFANDYTITNLSSDTNYYIKIRSLTNPHVNNKNIVYSDFSDVIKIRTPCTISVYADANGSISPCCKMPVLYGDDKKFSIIPDFGYHIKELKIDTKPIDIVEEYTFENITRNHSIYAGFDNYTPTIKMLVSSYTMNEDTISDPVKFKVSDETLSGDDLKYSIISSDPDVIDQEHFTFSGEGNDRWLTITPPLNSNGFVKITVMAEDVMYAGSDSFDLTIVSINDLPEALDYTYTVYEDTRFDDTLYAYDVDRYGYITYVIIAKPEHGKATIVEKLLGTFAYKPDENFSGSDSFAYTVKDREDDCQNVGIVTLNVKAINDSPVANAGSDITVTEGETVILDGSNSSDVDDITISYEWYPTDSNFSLENNSYSIVKFTAPYVPPESDSITLTFWLITRDKNFSFSKDDINVIVMKKIPPIKPQAIIGKPEGQIKGTIPLIIDFQDKSNGYITNWLWDFGDGNTSNLKNPQYTYDSPGRFTVKLTVTGPGGSDQIAKQNFIIVVVPQDSDPPAIPLNERNALIDFYNNTNGDNWEINRNWAGVLGTECSWYGIYCIDYHVTEIELFDNRLSGVISKKIGNLQLLEKLWLSDNGISGNIVPEIGSLFNLNYLYLRSNRLTGNIPSSIGNLKKLKVLYLNYSNLDGEIPPEIGNLESLQDLSLAGNKLTGNIPVELSLLDELCYLYLYDNQLDGNIPFELSNLSKLERLWLGKNNLTGDIPYQLSKLNNLKHLYLNNNKLSGIIPPELSGLLKLRFLDLSFNELSGEIPVEISKLINLQEIKLNNNQLSGQIIPELSNINNLKILNLSNNLFSPSIPIELFNLKYLEELSLSGNLLSGLIPQEISNLIYLRKLDLSNNQFSDNISDKACQLKALRNLNLSNNNLNGSIPENIGILINLEELNLSKNSLTSEIPSSLTGLIKIQSIDFSSNTLSGSIPSNIKSLLTLQKEMSDFSYNALYTYDVELKAFINKIQKGGDFESTQTIAPSYFSVLNYPDDMTKAILSWQPIKYSNDEGYYEIYQSDNPDGPFVLREIVNDKSSSSFTATDLELDTVHYFIIRTVTKANEFNKNDVYSEYSYVRSVATTTGVIRPTSPSDLKLVSAIDQKVEISWNLIIDPEGIYYNIYRSESEDGLYYQLNSLPLTNNKYIDLDVQNSKTYYYKLRSFLDGVPGRYYSPILSVKPDYFHVTISEPEPFIQKESSKDYEIEIVPLDGFNGRVELSLKGLPGSKSEVTNKFIWGIDDMGDTLRNLIIPANVILRIITGKDAKFQEYNYYLVATNLNDGKTREYEQSFNVVDTGTCSIFINTLDEDVTKNAKIYGSIFPEIASESISLSIYNHKGLYYTPTVLTDSFGDFEYEMASGEIGTYTVFANWLNASSMTDVCSDGVFEDSDIFYIRKRNSTLVCNSGSFQEMPSIGENFMVSCSLSPEITDTTLNLLVTDPDGSLNNYILDQSYENDKQIFSIVKDFFTKKGLYSFKAVFPGSDTVNGCQSNIINIAIEIGSSKAVIIGGGYDEDDIIYQNAVKHACENIYFDLVKKGFKHDDIHLMVMADDFDYNKDKITDSVIDNTFPIQPDVTEAISNKFENYLSIYLPLIIYLNGQVHKDGQFQLPGAGQFIDASSISSAISDIQEKTNCNVIVIIDSPQAGYLGKFLSGNNRIILTSSIFENYIIDMSDELSFSKFLFSNLKNGQNYYAAFEKAKEQRLYLNFKEPGIDDNGDGIFNTIDDGQLSKNLFLTGNNLKNTSPKISFINLNSNLIKSSSSFIEISATVADSPISKVSAQVIFPDIITHNDNDIISFKELILEYDSIDDVYKGVLSCLSKSGKYTIVGHVYDQNYDESEPFYSFINVEEHDHYPSIYCENSISNLLSMQIMCYSDNVIEHNPNFQNMNTGTEKHLWGIYGFTKNDVYAVGENGIVIHYNGDVWLPMTQVTDKRLICIRGLSNNSIYACGDFGTIIFYDGEKWISMDSKTKLSIKNIMPISENDVYAVGSSGLILHYNGFEWERIYGYGISMLNDLSLSENSIFAVGENGTILHNNAQNWYQMESCSLSNFDKVWSCSDHIFAVDYLNMTYMYNGNGWMEMNKCNSTVPIKYNSVWISSKKDVFLAGFNGIILYSHIDNQLRSFNIFESSIFNEKNQRCDCNNNGKIEIDDIIYMIKNIK